MEQPPPRGHVFDLHAIGAALRGLSAEMARFMPVLADPLFGRADVAMRLLDGYAYVDALLGDGRDPFAYGGSQLLLEMNHQVLCGASPDRRAEFAPHLAATRRRFYEDHLCGADAFYAWVERSRHLKPVAFAAGAYRRIVETPQVFIEGNQRTATLVASFVLGRAGLPPLVATARTFAALSALSAGCKALDRRWRPSLPWGRFLEMQLQSFIHGTADAGFLAKAAPSRPEPAHAPSPRS